MGLRAMVQQYQEKREIRKFQRDNEWEGLVPGDVVEYKGQKYMFKGVNKNGGPGMPGFPEPLFGVTHPRNANTVYYLRQVGYEFPESVFGEGTQPVQAGNTGMSIAFLNASRDDLKRVGHITPDEWRVMVEELRRELAGKK